jgi:hypothetical protein
VNIATGGFAGGKMLRFRLCLIAVLALMLAGCGGYRVQDNPKQTVGAVGGAGVGALAGS